MSDENPESQETPLSEDTHPPSPSATVPLPICPAEKWKGSELECKSLRPSRRTSRTAFTASVPQLDEPLLGFAP